MADLIREGIEIYIEALEDDDYDGGNSVGVLLITALNRHEFVTENIGDYDTMAECYFASTQMFWDEYADEQGSRVYEGGGTYT